MAFQRRRSTPAGQHRPVMLTEVLEVLNPQPGMVAVDCTVGFGGHSEEILRRQCTPLAPRAGEAAGNVGPPTETIDSRSESTTLPPLAPRVEDAAGNVEPKPDAIDSRSESSTLGKLIALDMDGEHRSQVRERLERVGHPFELLHANFAGLDRILMERGLKADLILADLGMSSMQVDDPERGFSYARDGALDMRMDRSRGKTAAQLLAEIKEDDLRLALADLGDEPQAGAIARLIVETRQRGSLQRTSDLAGLIVKELGDGAWRLHPTKGKWNLHPAARTFQALRILLNRELGNLTQLLRVLPDCLTPGGTAAIISFHSGEDRLVKRAFREGLRAGVYAQVSEDALRPAFAERTANPRSRSAKLRWARRAGDGF